MAWLWDAEAQQYYWYDSSRDEFVLQTGVRYPRPRNVTPEWLLQQARQALQAQQANTEGTSPPSDNGYTYRSNLRESANRTGSTVEPIDQSLGNLSLGNPGGRERSQQGQQRASQQVQQRVAPQGQQRAPPQDQQRPAPHGQLRQQDSYRQGLPSSPANYAAGGPRGPSGSQGSSATTPRTTATPSASSQQGTVSRTPRREVPSDNEESSEEEDEEEDSEEDQDSSTAPPTQNQRLDAMIARYTEQGYTREQALAAMRAIAQARQPQPQPQSQSQSQSQSQPQPQQQQQREQQRPTGQARRGR
ncbi:hypothetical protein LTR85_002334 [Meristemomyces frigidus]|nr:hypothetical protein LTR85_002334 [Meristemomyces frigidus]